MKKWLKNNKKTAIIIAIVSIALLLLVIFTVKFINYLMPNTKESVYGERCEITKDYPVSADRKEKIEEFLKEYKKMDLIEYKVQCNLITLIVEVDDKVKLSEVKSMGKKLLKVFSEDEADNYDINLMVRSNKDESSVYPVIGSHHKKINGKINKDFIW